MTTISRRGFTVGLGAAALAMPKPWPATGRIAEPELSGYVVATRFDLESGELEPGVAVFDLARDAETTVELPAIGTLFPIEGSAAALALGDQAGFIVDAASATATEIRPLGDTQLGAAFLDVLPVQPFVTSPSPRYEIVAEGVLPRWLIDVEEATVLDLIAAFALDDSFFQAAAFTADGSRLLLANGERIVVVSLATMEIERTLSETLGIRSPQLSPGGTRIAYVEPDATRVGPDAVALRLAAVDDGDPITVYVDGLGSLDFRWITDDEVLLTMLTRYTGTALTRLDLRTGLTTAFGVVPGAPANPRILANGTRAIASSDLDPATVWWLVDLEGDAVLRVPELEGMVPHGPPSRAARAVLFGPDDYAGIGVAGQRYSVLNTATGAITTSVSQVADQFYPPPVISPDNRSAAIGSSGPAGEELWLLDMVSGDLVALPDHLGAIYAPDGRSILTREVGPSKPLAIRSLDGTLIRELSLYDRAWWLG